MSEWPITNESKEALQTLTGILWCSKGAIEYRDGL